jgi:2,3-bisphosphoglycerate-independent phosphoglycerate mutase
MSDKHRPIVIIIRDGWGANPHPEWNHANAVHLAKTPVDTRLMATYPHVQIKTCGNDVGLPEGVAGNSEVGHQNIGAGRIVEQELMRITARIRDGAFFKNPELIGAFEQATKTGGNVHIMGLVSDGRVHSDPEHLDAILDLSSKLGFPGERVFVHAFTDGRDTSPTSGIDHVHRVEQKCEQLGINPVATVVGRFYAMDRDNRWDRIETAYRLLTQGRGQTFACASDAIRHHYDNPSSAEQKGDEFVPPSVVARDGMPLATIKSGDTVIYFNYRGDRPRQLTKAFTYDEFPSEGASSGGTFGFDRGEKLDLHFVTMTAYETGLPVRVAFEKPPKMQHILGQLVADQGMKQFRCAETEKYAHVTFFFNDYRDEPFAGEDRLIVPSPRDVTTYDQKPEMAAIELTRAVLDRIATGQDDLIVLNYANGDMVGHTGNLNAAIRAVETVDECVGKVADAVVASGGGLIVTADHGNCEQMIDPKTGGLHTSHTVYDVELIVVDDRYKGRSLREGGRLADIGPTALTMLGMMKPGEMTGECLLGGA